MYASRTTKLLFAGLSLVVFLAIIALAGLALNRINLAKAAEKGNTPSSSELAFRDKRKRHLTTPITVAAVQEDAAQSGDVTTDQLRKKCRGQRCHLGTIAATSGDVELMGSRVIFDPNGGITPHTTLMGGIAGADPTLGSAELMGYARKVDNTGRNYNAAIPEQMGSRVAFDPSGSGGKIIHSYGSLMGGIAAVDPTNGGDPKPMGGRTVVDANIVTGELMGGIAAMDPSNGGGWPK